MIKKVVFFAFLFLSLYNIKAQKAQRIGYIDMEYILENIPEYATAQATINSRGVSWQNKIEQQQNEIDNLKADLRNEKALLTKELIEERNEDIQIKELELKKLQESYFGSEGELFILRMQLVKPIQDLVYNAVQDIATKRRYDFVLDKSTDLIMLYTNKQYDISDLIIANINKAKKTSEINAKKNKNKKSTESSENEPVVISEEAQKKIDAKELKRAQLQQQLDEKRAAQLKKREELLKANEERKQQRIKEIEAAKKAKENKNN